MKLLISSGLSKNGQALKKYYEEKFNAFVIVSDATPSKNALTSPNALEVDHYANFLQEIVVKNSIDKYIPCSDHDLFFLSKLPSDNMLFKFGIPSKKTINNYIDKLISCKLAESYFDVPCPSINCDIYIRNRFSWQRPKLFEKVPVEQKNELNYDFEKLIISRFLIGDEYTADVYFDGKSLPAVSIRKRLDVIGGISTRGEILNDERLTEKISNFVINENIYGFSCTQFIKEDGKFYYIETNTRPGGGVGISFGFDNLKLR